MLDIFEIVSLLESKTLQANSYVFELRKKQWIQVRAIDVLVHTGYKFSASENFDEPTFIPPHKLPEDFSYDVSNGDYLYLLNHLNKIQSRKEQLENSDDSVKNNKERMQLESTIVELNEVISKLDSENQVNKELNGDLENLLYELKSNIQKSEHRVNALENELLQKEVELNDTVDKSNRELEQYRQDFKENIEESSKSKMQVQSLLYKIESLKFALRVEKEKYQDLKDVFNNQNSHKEKDTIKDKVLEQAFSYFIQGPVGNGSSELEIEKLNKKIEFLNAELDEKDSYLKKKVADFDKELAAKDISLNKKINTLKSELLEKEDFYKDKIATFSSSCGEDKELYREKVTDLERRYQVKISELGNDKRELKARISSLESELEKSYEKSDALINTVSRPTTDAVKNDAKFIELKDRFEKSVENYEQMLAFKDDKIKNLINDQQSGSTNTITEIDNLEVEKLRTLNRNYVKEKELLGAQIKKLSEQRMDLAKRVEAQQGEIKEYKNINQKLIAQIEELEKRSSAYKDEYKKLFEKNNKAIQKIQAQSSKLSSLADEKQVGLVQSQKEVDELVNQMLDYKSQAEKEKKRALELAKNLEQIKESESKIELESVKSSSEDDSSSSQDELNRLIGDSYEVENDAIWTVQFEDGMKSGPHPFSVVYDMKEKGEITPTTRVKKAGDGFKNCADIFELSTRVFTHGEDENRRFFIKRNSVRVPYYELITFEMGGNEFKGYCTSISSGGIFIELSNVKSDDLKVKNKGRVLFPAGAIDRPFNCVAQIMNVSESRPKGIGLMFIDLPEAAKEDILNYVNTYLNRSKKSA
ncbi:PilZ domain-containing protein [Halobacteriovorax sp. HLS]|uniref:PilZ domain-containing protein n=1 Tax=Halobacteriovorax sp. HLS TaxID=2234000 RepID=UPI000FDAAB7D|nr:PilZ domain-containing protein [Halobacteriovorax sp. HLS]